MNRKSEIIFGNFPFKDEFKDFKDRKKLLITDENLYKIYKIDLEDIKHKKLFIYRLRPGEESKNFKELGKIYDLLLEESFTRSDLIIGLGGGVVGDLAGMAAATYMRGIKYINIPTSLLAQVDSSLGGKVGVDYKGYKNLIGTFYFPQKLLIDLDFLVSLDKENMLCGLAEIIKYGLIYDNSFFEYIFVNMEEILKKNRENLGYIVEKSLQIKSFYVYEDMYDKGSRHSLNFGHTVGHAIESFYAFKKYNHGQAVLMGMVYEAYISFKLSILSREEFDIIYKRLASISNLEKFSEEDIDNLIEIMKKDKKNKSDKISMILLNRIGNSIYKEDIDEKLIRQALKGEWM